MIMIVFERFKAALVSAPDRAGEAAVLARPSAAPRFARGLATLGTGDRGPASAPRQREGPSEMAALVGRVRAAGAPPVHQVWLPLL